LVEHNLAKVGVAGSNPVVRSSKAAGQGPFGGPLPRAERSSYTGPMATAPNDPILDGVVTPDGEIVVDRAQVTRLGVSPGAHVTLTIVTGRRIRSYLGSGDHLGPAPGHSSFRELRDELWKGLGEGLAS
jgi:hypothetical protein